MDKYIMQSIQATSDNEVEMIYEVMIVLDSNDVHTAIEWVSSVTPFTPAELLDMYDNQ